MLITRCIDTVSRISDVFQDAYSEYSAKGNRVQDVSPDDITGTRKRRVDEISIPGYDTPVFEVAYGKQLYLVSSTGENILYCGDATTDNETRIIPYANDRFIAVNVPEEALTCTGSSYAIPNTEECRATGDERDFNTDLWYVIDRNTPIGVDFTTPPSTLTTLNNGDWVFMQSPTKTCVWKHGSKEQGSPSTRITVFENEENDNGGLPRAEDDELSESTPLGEEINAKSATHTFPDTTPTVDMRVKFNTDTLTCFLEDVMRVEPHIDSIADAKAYLNGSIPQTPTDTDLRDQYHASGLDSPTAQRIIDEHGYSRHELTITDKLRVMKHVTQHRKQCGDCTRTDDVDARTKHAAEELLSDVESH